MVYTRDMSQIGANMSADTPAQRKAAERDRKRAQGLVLKQVWVPPQAWPLLSALATEEVETHVYSVQMNGGVYGIEGDYEDGTSVSFAYELADELMQEVLARGENHFGADKAAPFLMRVMRAMLKTYDPNAKAIPELVKAYGENEE
jgi:hypothetical protein